MITVLTWRILLCAHICKFVARSALSGLGFDCCKSEVILEPTRDLSLDFSPDQNLTTAAHLGKNEISKLMSHFFGPCCAAIFCIWRLSHRGQIDPERCHTFLAHAVLRFFAFDVFLTEARWIRSDVRIFWPMLWWILKFPKRSFLWRND